MNVMDRLLIAGLRQAIPDYRVWMETVEINQLSDAATRPQMIDAMVRYAREFVDFVDNVWCMDRSLTKDGLEKALQGYHAHLDSDDRAVRTRREYARNSARFVEYLNTEWSSGTGPLYRE